MTGLMIVFFSPLTLISVSAKNMGVIKDLLCYLNILMFLQDGSESPIWHLMVIGVSLYIDPSSIFFNLGIVLCTSKKLTVLEALISVTLPFVLLTMNSNSQIQNALNIMTLRDHSENIGLYWYISIEIFKNHTDFFKYAYVLYNFMMIAQIRQLI